MFEVWSPVEKKLLYYLKIWKKKIVYNTNPNGNFPQNMILLFKLFKMSFSEIIITLLYLRLWILALSFLLQICLPHILNFIIYFLHKKCVFLAEEHK